MAGALSMSMWSGHASSTRTYTRNEGFLDERGDYGALPDALYSSAFSTCTTRRGDNTHRRRQAVSAHLYAWSASRTRGEQNYDDVVECRRGRRGSLPRAANASTHALERPPPDNSDSDHTVRRLPSFGPSGLLDFADSQRAVS